jgi:hypothetical protein
MRFPSWSLTRLPRAARRAGLLVLALLASGALLLLSSAFASQAMAATTVPVSMTFTEPIVPAGNSGCPLETSSCGQGQVIPFGQATETILFGGACGGNCDFRTINLAGGTIYIDEFFSNPTCPGACQPNPARPFGGALADVIVGGTGNFTGASGNLSGSVSVAGGGAVIKLSGTITLP